ncbi:MAG TPA: hypothetical protein EYO58_00475, partial [Flavobacteriales bacterium]|nr:hypothetical protein [Flavobacteriales bacterium]
MEKIMFHSSTTTNAPRAAQAPSVPASSQTEAKEWFQLSGRGITLRYSEEKDGLRNVICESSNGGSHSKSSCVVSAGNFTSSNGAFILKGIGKSLFINGKKVNFAKGKPVAAPQQAPQKP